MNEWRGPRMTNGSGHHGDRDLRAGKKNPKNARKAATKPPKRPKK